MTNKFQVSKEKVQLWKLQAVYVRTLTQETNI